MKTQSTATSCASKTDNMNQFIQETLNHYYNVYDLWETIRGEDWRVDMKTHGLTDDDVRNHKAFDNIDSTLHKAFVMLEAAIGQMEDLVN